jgi:hypothetical protein
MNPFPSTAFRNAVLGRTVELVPLVEVYLVDGSYAYASDRAIDLTSHGGLNYLARLVDWSGVTMAIDLTNTSGTPSSSATFTFSNVDRTMDAAADQHMFQRGSVIFKAYAPKVISGGGTLAQAVRTIWVGYIESTPYDDQVFTLSCKDGFFDLSLPLPRRRFSRTCEWEFDDGCYCPYSAFGYTGAGTGVRLLVQDLTGVFAETAYPNNTGGIPDIPTPIYGLGDFGPDIGQAGIGNEGYLSNPGYTQCDKTFGDQPGDNGCLQRGMARFFGAQRYITSWSRGRTGAGGIGGFFNLSLYTSYSSLNENIFDQGMPLVYCNHQTGYTLNPTLFQWRPESQYIAAECVVCEGPIGAYMPAQGGQADYKVDGIKDVLANAVPPHAGQNPRNANVGVARSPGRIGDTLLWEQIAGDLRQSDEQVGAILGFPKVYFSGAAGFFIRAKDSNAGVNDPTQSETSATSTPDVYAEVISGRRVWVYFSDGAGNFYRQYNPDTQGGNGNPAWIILDMILEAFDIKYAIIARHAELVDLQSFITSAAYFAESTPGVQGTGIPQRYWFAGIVADLSPATDHIDSALRDCHAYRFFRNGKIAIMPFSACQFDTIPRPGFQEFVNMKLTEFKPTIPKPEYNEIWLNYADHDFDFQKNVAQVYSQDYQALVGLNGHPFKMTKTLNMMGTPYVEQATRIGLRMLRHTLGGTSHSQWAQLREAEVPSSFMMTELEPGDVTYVSHSLMPGGGDWVRISGLTINKDWSVNFKVRSWRSSAYDDNLGPDSASVDLAKFPHQLQIHSGLGIVYAPNPQIPWADVDPIAAIDNVGMRLSWQLYAAESDNAKLRAVALFRSLDNVLAAGGYLKEEVNGSATSWTVATDSADYSTDPANMRNVYFCGAEQVAVTDYHDNGDGTGTLTVTRNVNGTDPESHQRYDWIKHISFLDQLPRPQQVQALVSMTQYIDPADTSS